MFASKLLYLFVYLLFNFVYAEIFHKKVFFFFSLENVALHFSIYAHCWLTKCVFAAAVPPINMPRNWLWLQWFCVLFCFLLFIWYTVTLTTFLQYFDFHCNLLLIASDHQALLLSLTTNSTGTIVLTLICNIKNDLYVFFVLYNLLVKSNIQQPFVYLKIQYFYFYLLNFAQNYFTKLAFPYLLLILAKNTNTITTNILLSSQFSVQNSSSKLTTHCRCTNCKFL